VGHGSGRECAGAINASDLGSFGLIGETDQRQGERANLGEC